MMIMPNCNICKYAGRPTYKSPCSECKEFSKYEYENKKTNAVDVAPVRCGRWYDTDTNTKEVLTLDDCMNFPKRWEDFLYDYEFEDRERIYTNGSWLIPSFRVKQMVEHYFPADVAPVRHGRGDVDNGKEK